MLIFTLPLYQSCWNHIDTQLLQFVSKQRQQKILNYRFPLDKRLSLYAALLIRMELSNLTNIPAKELSFSEKFQKPLLISVPEYHFNFSHTRNYILCSISDTGSVGVDVETIATPPLDIMNLIFHTTEKNYILNSNFDLQPKRFFKIWTQKESLAKFKGDGLTDDLIGCNTLDPAYEKSFISWKDDCFACSVYCPSSKYHKQIAVTEKIIQDYYLTTLF